MIFDVKVYFYFSLFDLNLYHGTLTQAMMTQTKKK